MLEMVIDSIRVSLMNYQRVVILKERQADRYLPIWIGSPEADAIAVRLQDVTVPRPLTHDLLGVVMGELGAALDHIVVSDLQNDTFYAKLVLALKDGTSKSIDCRPSDAIALAVRGGHLVSTPSGEERWFKSMPEAQKFLEQMGVGATDDRYEIRSKVPIFVEEKVMDSAGILMDGGEPTSLPESRKPSAERAAKPKPVTEEEIERMSAFKDLLQDLPGLEELGGNPGSAS